MKYIAIIILGIIVLGLTHSRIGDMVGIAIVAYGLGMLYVSEKNKWEGNDE